MPIEPAVNYYDLLQINPRAELEAIERVYRILSARYHPSNLETGNAERFRLLTEAYEVLRDPVRRANYDRQFAKSHTYSRTARDLVWNLTRSGTLDNPEQY